MVLADDGEHPQILNLGKKDTVYNAAQINALPFNSPFEIHCPLEDFQRTVVTVKHSVSHGHDLYTQF